MPVEYKKVKVEIPENVRELFAQNLKEIQSCFPETKKYDSLNKIPNKAIFARLMDTQKVSFTAAEAFALANLEYVNTHPDVYKKGIKKLLQVIDKLEKRLGDEQSLNATKTKMPLIVKKNLRSILSECMREAVSVEDLAERLAATDVVPVVRCGNCRYFQSDDDKRPGFCTNPRIAVVESCRPQSLSCPLMPRDGFCSKGEEKDDA